MNLFTQIPLLFVVMKVVKIDQSYNYFTDFIQTNRSWAYSYLRVNDFT